MDQYRTVLLDTALEIRNMPVDTIAYSDNIGDSRKVAVKLDDSRWARTDSDSIVSDAEMVGWVAMERIHNGIVF